MELNTLNMAMKMECFTCIQPKSMMAIMTTDTGNLKSNLNNFNEFIISLHNNCNRNQLARNKVLGTGKILFCFSEKAYSWNSAHNL